MYEIPDVEDNIFYFVLLVYLEDTRVSKQMLLCK